MQVLAVIALIGAAHALEDNYGNDRRVSRSRGVDYSKPNYEHKSDRGYDAG